MDEEGVLAGPVVTAPPDSPADIARAFAQARALQPQWAGLTLRHRAQVCARLHRLLTRRRRRLLDLLAEDTGIPDVTGEHELEHLLYVLRHHARTAGPRLPRLRHPAALRPRPRPKGVVAVIGAWTYPVTYAAADVVAALVAGHAVVQQIDPSAIAVATFHRQAAQTAGLPTWLWQIVSAPTGHVHASVVEHADRVRYCGPLSGARRVAKLGALWLRDVRLHTGRINPVFVLADADLDRAADGIARACLHRAGQTCLTSRHVYVAEPVHDAFAGKLAARLAALHEQGMGRLTFPWQPAALDAHVTDAVAAGAHVLRRGGAEAGDDPLHYGPVLLTAASAEPPMPGDQEIGPVVCLASFGDQSQALEHVHHNGPALHATVYTGDPARGHALATRLPAPAVSVNPARPPAPPWHVMHDDLSQHPRAAAMVTH